MSDIETTTTAAEAPVAQVAPAKEDLLQTRRTQKVGTVVSDKMDKTVVVAVNYVRRHPLYHKRITRTTKFLAHDENNLAKPGDVVRIEETRPMSKRKRWIVREIVEKAVQI